MAHWYFLPVGPIRMGKQYCFKLTKLSKGELSITNQWTEVRIYVYYVYTNFHINMFDSGRATVIQKSSILYVLVHSPPGFLPVRTRPRTARTAWVGASYCTNWYRATGTCTVPVRYRYNCMYHKAISISTLQLFCHTAFTAFCHRPVY